MSDPAHSSEALRAENAELRARLEKAEDMLRAIHAGEVGDITRRQTEDELRASEEFSRSLMDGSADCVKVLDLDGRLLGMNAPGLCLMEIDNFGPMCSQPWSALWPADARRDIERSMAAARAGGSCSFEAFCPTAKGTPRWWNVVVSPIRDGAGGPVRRILAISRDITQRRQAEREQQSTHALLDSLLHSAPIGFCFLDRDLRYVRINEQLAAMNGIPVAAHVGRAVSEVVPALTAQVEAVTARILATGETVKDHEFNGETPLAPGVARFWRESWYPVPDGSGGLAGFGAVVEEITALKHAEAARKTSEERVRLASEAAQMGFWSWLPDEDLVVWENEYPYRILGVAPSSPAVTGARFAAEFLHPADLPIFEQAIARTVQAHEPFEFAGRIRRPDGETRWIEFTGKPELAEEGRARRIVGTVQDITGRKLAEAALRESAGLLRAATDNASVGLVSLDLERRYKFANPAYCRILGLPAEIVGKGPAELLPSVYTEQIKPRLDRAFAGERIAYELAMPAPGGADGQINHYSVVYEPERDGDGNITGVVVVVFDITERKWAEEALREAENRLRYALASAGAGAWDWDIRTGNIVWSPENYQLYGFEPAQGSPLYVDWESRVHPEDRDRVNEEVRAVVEGRTAEFRTEFRVVPRDGTTRWLLGLGRVHRDQSGQPLRMSGLNLDITERKRVEKAQSENAALFSTLIAQAPMGTYVVDGQFRLHQVNSEAMPVFVSVRPLIGRDFQEVLEILWGPEVGGRCADIFRHTLATGERYVSPPFTEKRHDLGIEQSYEWQTQRVTLPDGQQGVVCYFHEVTERARATEALRASGERMRLAAEATGVGIWEWNILTNAIRWDAPMFRLYGVPPTEDGLVHYETWSRAVMAEDLPRQEEVLQDTVRRCGQSSREFRILRTDDGECRWIQAVETVRTNAEGKAEWVIGTNLDVTERKDAERAIREEATRKDEFLAMLGHELRNPLNAIRHAVQISSETPEDTEACEWAAKVIDRQSQQLARMVDDLLDVARINRGRIELRVESLELGPVLEHAIASVRPLLAERRHTFTSDIGTQLHITGDAARLQQVYVNLLTNAAKYTPEGGSIALRAQSEDGEAVVTIADNGEGIPRELLPHVFDLFRQAESNLDRALGGLGIGLSVVRSLVEMHLGRVAITSPGANAGTTVTVRLPRLLELPAAARPPTAPTPDAPAPKPLRVLIVDDHEDAAQALARLLNRRGCEVRCAHTGPDGVAAAREFQPEALLLDLGLPGFDGYQLARILRAEAAFAEALFIAISGYAQSGDREKCFAAGFDEHFAKPLDFPKLVEAIQARQPA